MPYVSVEVDIELDQIDTEDLVEELERRGVETDLGQNITEDIRGMYDKYILGKSIDEELRNLFYKTIGRIA